MAEYDLGDIHNVAIAGGTAWKTWEVTTFSRGYFLRLRRIRTSNKASLLFDYELREHIVAHGIPTVIAIHTKRGNRGLNYD